MRPPQGDGGGAPRGNNSYNNNGGNRLELRQRGNATQLLEKYKALARDAAQNGDRVATEYYMQHADHYYRVLNDYRERQPDNRQPPRRDYDDDDSGEGQNYNNGQSGPQNYVAQQSDVGGYDDDGDQGDAVPSRAGEQDDNRMAQPPRQDQSPRGEQNRPDSQRQPERPQQRDDYRKQNSQADSARRPDTRRDERRPEERGGREHGYNERQADGGQASGNQSNGSQANSSQPAANATGERHEQVRQSNERQSNGNPTHQRPNEPSQERSSQRGGNDRTNGYRQSDERSDRGRQDGRYDGRQESARDDNGVQAARQGSDRLAGDRLNRRPSREEVVDRTPVLNEPASTAQEQSIFAGIPGPATRPVEPAPAAPAIAVQPIDMAATVEPVLPLEGTSAQTAAEPAVVPRKRGRPRKIVVEATVEN